MVLDDTREKIVFQNYKWTAPKYYDYPDGEDLLGKLSFTTKVGFFCGAVFGLIHTFRIGPKPKSNMSALLRSLTWVAPGVGAPFAFTTVTYAATNIRGKDDQINYLLGSIAAAAAGASLAGIPQRTLGLAVIFSVIGVAKKTAQMQGTILFPPTTRKLNCQCITAAKPWKPEQGHVYILQDSFNGYPKSVSVKHKKPLNVNTIQS